MLLSSKGRAVIDLLKLYDILKPESNPDAYTEYPLILGGSDTTISLEKGAWVLNPLNSKAETKPFLFVMQEEDQAIECQRRVISTNYQLDFYKSFDNGVDHELVTQKEAVSMQAWLNSQEVGLALLNIDGEILPVQDSITYTSELGLNKVVLNRASFDFTILSYELIGVDVELLEKINLQGGFINAKISRN